MFVDERIVTLFKRNVHHTLTYWSLFFSFGLCIAFLGPTILDLQCQTNSTLSQITWVFFAQQFCLLIGSSIGGVFRKTWVRQTMGTHTNDPKASGSIILFLSLFSVEGCSALWQPCASQLSWSLLFLPSSRCVTMSWCWQLPWLCLGWPWVLLTPLLTFSWWPSIRRTLLFSYRWGNWLIC